MSDLIRRAIREENPEVIKQYHREQVERNRRLLEERGAQYDEEMHRIRSLVSPEVQMRLFGCHRREDLGAAVFRALMGPTRPVKESFFVRSFNYPEAGIASREGVVSAAAVRIRTPYTILPPLLCRSRGGDAVGLEGAGSGLFRETKDHTRCSVLVVGQRRGPVVVVVRNDAVPLIEPFLTALYSASGFITPKQLVRECFRRKSWT
jgi:hypothetical protein